MSRDLLATRGFTEGQIARIVGMSLYLCNRLSGGETPEVLASRFAYKIYEPTDTLRPEPAYAVRATEIICPDEYPDVKGNLDRFFPWGGVPSRLK